MTEPHVISALVRKRAELAGLLAVAEKRAKRLRADLDHVDCTIKLFAPGSLPESIPPKRIYKYRVPDLMHGELPRLCLSILRRANGVPIAVDDLAATVIREKGLDASDEQLRGVVAKRTLEVLKAQRKRGLVEKSPVRGDSRWSLTGTLD